MEIDKALSLTSRPTRKRKRWIIAFAVTILWLPVAYELSFGPAVYLMRRGWLPAPFVVTYLGVPILPDAWGEAIGLWDYNRWWDDLGRQHAGLLPAKRG